MANLAMLLWPVLTLCLFATQPAARAATLSIVGSGLLLPVGFAFHFQGFPDIDRDTLAVFSSLAGYVIFRRDLLTRVRPLRGAEWLVVGMVIAALLTALNNGEPRIEPAKVLPGIAPWDGLSRSATALLTLGIPFYLGRVSFRSPRDLRWLMLALVVIGAIYALPFLWEVRMSPHLHYQVYGWQPASFSMAKRGFGWRPMVFVGHGLSLAVFLMATLIASISLWRSRSSKLRGMVHIAPFFFAVLLLLTSSLAATVYGLVAAFAFAFSTFRTQRWVLLALATLILSYPLLRAAEWFPTDTLVASAAVFSDSRAASLAYRFENEDKLLEHARRKPFFGWGGYGRDRIYDPRTGGDDIATDGYWIITFGQTGTVGFLCSFGLMLFPVLNAMRIARNRRADAETALMLGLSWIVALSALDLLPNAFLQVRTPFLAGALSGAVSGWRRRARSSTAGPPDKPEVDVGVSRKRGDAGLGAALLSKRGARRFFPAALSPSAH